MAGFGTSNTPVPASLSALTIKTHRRKKRSSTVVADSVDVVGDESLGPSRNRNRFANGYRKRDTPGGLCRPTPLASIRLVCAGGGLVVAKSERSGNVSIRIRSVRLITSTTGQNIPIGVLTL